jgi:hypothetical protein
MAKRQEGPRHDPGPYVQRGALIMGATKDYKRKVGIRTVTEVTRSTIATFSEKDNPNWEANLEHVLKLLNREGGYRARKLSPEEEGGKEKE